LCECDCRQFYCHKKKNIIVDKIFFPSLSVLFPTVYHYMDDHVSWRLNTLSRIGELQPQVTFSLAQILLQIEHEFEINIKDNLTFF